MAQVSRATFQTNLGNLINDNSAGEITAADVRSILTDLEDSALWYDEVAVGVADADYGVISVSGGVWSIDSGVVTLAALAPAALSGEGDLLATLVDADAIPDGNSAYLDAEGTLRTKAVEDAGSWPEKTALSGSEEVFLNAEQAYATVQGIADFANTEQTVTSPRIKHFAKTITASATLALGDVSATLDVTGASALTLTVTPGIAWEEGDWCVGTNQATAALTIQAASDAKINGVTNGAVTIPASTTGLYPHFSIRRGPSDNFIVNGTAS